MSHFIEKKVAGKRASTPKSRYSNGGKAKKTTKYKTKSGKKKGGSGLRIAAALLIVFMLIVMVLFTPLSSRLPLPWEGGGRVYPKEAEFVLQREITLTTRDQVDYTIDIPLPESIGNDIQAVREVNGDPDPQQIEKYGHDWMIWEGSIASRGSERSEKVSVTYSATTRTIDWGYSSDRSGNVEDFDESTKEKYNKNQWQLDVDRNGDGEDDWMIQPDHPVIQQKAEEIVEGETNIYDKARALYDWLNDNIAYRLEGDNRPKHAIWTYNERAGDCDEQSFLYISMARSLGIPAWIEFGMLYDRMRDDWGNHGWIRLKFVTVEGETGWVNIDPVNQQFFARDALRLTVWADDAGETDGEPHLQDFYTFLTYSGGTLQSWEEEFTTPEMEKSGTTYLDDTDYRFISGFQLYHLAVSGAITTFIYAWRKKKKRP
ncbi:MAG: transglutaminase-like domain-containing protein [Candidatus Natronoplasma sp.]